MTFFVGLLPIVLANQALALLVMIAWTSSVIVVIMKGTVGNDVSPLIEDEGLDMIQIGEQAYDERLDLQHDIGEEACRCQG